MLPPVLAPTSAHRCLVPRALQLLSDEEPCAIFYDMKQFRDGLIAIRDAFPSFTTHAIAMKANPLAACLLVAKELGMGCEVASPCELQHALRLGFSPSKIVMDSPAKTRRDIRTALEAGCCLNADNFEELERINIILTEHFGGGGRKGLGTCTSQIGVRVNPQYGEGAIAATGTIAATSKFGVPLQDMKNELLLSYKKYAWLTCLHCHVGSQGCEQELLVRGSQSILDLAEEINSMIEASEAISQQIRVLDIGGGMAVDYTSDNTLESKENISTSSQITPHRYALALQRNVPDLFSGKYSLITEFGRYVSAKCGVILSRVEYVKSAGGRKICVIHCGADLMLRTCYDPKHWPHRVSSWSEFGDFMTPSMIPSGVTVEPTIFKTNDVGVSSCCQWDVVGPLCFRGDIVAENITLPSKLSSGCVICIHDAGAYTLSMFSKYNSRQAPPVYGYTYDDEHVETGENSSNDYAVVTNLEIKKLSNGETSEEALRMWQLP